MFPVGICRLAADHSNLIHLHDDLSGLLTHHMAEGHDAAIRFRCFSFCEHLHFDVYGVVAENRCLPHQMLYGEKRHPGMMKKSELHSEPFRNDKRQRPGSDTLAE